ncbi:MAG: hypothetical protein CBR30_02240 [Dictyoglomus sp. NZ13-RE01]|nr:MAG: hypothetical protein CBR30_02240 [Dictyoglomus sp. NZ13-RE01]
MQNLLILILFPPLISIFQSIINLGNLNPYFLLLFYVFVFLKDIIPRYYFLYISLWDALFSSATFYQSLLFWFFIFLILEVLRARLILAHKVISMLIIIFLSILSLIYWNVYNILLPEKILFFISANILFFIPFYIFLPNYLGTNYEKT